MKTLTLIGDVGFEITGDYIRRNVDFNSTAALRVFVNSPGGFIVDAIEIYNLFKSYKGEVEFVILAYAASAMSYIIMAGDKITAFKNSIFMAHRAQTISIGNADELLRDAQIAASLDGVIADAYVPRLGATREEILAKLKDEIWLIGWDQMSAAGLIDDVVESLDGLGVPADTLKAVNDEVDANPELSNFVRLRVAQAQHRSRQANTSGLERAAAFLNLESHPADNAGEDNSTRRDQMKLQEFLNSTPDAKAEYDALLQAAEAKGRDAATSALNADRERLAKILQLEGVALSDTAAQAIAGDMSVESYMEAELLRQKGIREQKQQNANPFTALVAKPTPKDQDPGSVPPAPADDLTAFEAKAREIAKKQYGGK